MEDVPRCNDRGVAVSTYPWIFGRVGAPVIARDNGTGEAAKVTPGDVTGPEEPLLPIHPTVSMAVPDASIGTVRSEHTAGRAAVSAFVVARAVVVGRNTTHKTPSETLHKILDSFAVLFSRCTVELGSKSGKYSRGGRPRGRNVILNRGGGLNGSRRRSGGLNGNRRRGGGLNGNRSRGGGLNRNRHRGGRVNGSGCSDFDGLRDERVDIAFAEIAEERAGFGAR